MKEQKYNFIVIVIIIVYIVKIKGDYYACMGDL